jgi:hypothetical protein
MERLEVVTRGMVNSRKVLWDIVPAELHAGLKMFCAFLDQQNSIHAPKSRDALR